jgi:hypothetical protein
MKTLDLHGVRHSDVDRLVENFVLLEDLPVKIIIGNSPDMQLLTTAVIERHELGWDYESHINLGAIVVTSSSI